MTTNMTSLTRRIYSRAPVVEAVIDFQVTQPPDFQITMLKQVVAEGYFPYSSEEDLWEISKVFSPSGDEIKTEKRRLGYRYRSSDQKYILQVRQKGFTLSRLAPYIHWEEFSTEAKRLWERFEAVTNPRQVERAAVRYVNRLDLPLPVTDLKQFLTVCPDAPDKLGGHTIAYLMQLQQLQPELNATLVLNQATVPPVRPGVISIILDLDLFSTLSSDKPRPDLWRLIDSLHGRVEQIFETCITDEVRRLIE
jgi:uncharacterized protein (TIGR04255 family)